MPADDVTDERSPTVVCVLGMHRSGTSAVTRILNLLGMDLGPEARLMPPRPDKPAGFWEHDEIWRLNDELLERLGGSWDRPPALRPGWHRRRRLNDLRARARELLETDFSGRALWGWKDPRACLTLPFWRALLPPMRYVVSLRNPLAVAASLAERNGMAMQEAGALWDPLLPPEAKGLFAALRAHVAPAGGAADDAEAALERLLAGSEEERAEVVRAVSLLAEPLRASR